MTDGLTLSRCARSACFQPLASRALASASLNSSVTVACLKSVVSFESSLVALCGAVCVTFLTVSTSPLALAAASADAVVGFDAVDLRRTTGVQSASDIVNRPAVLVAVVEEFGAGGDRVRMRLNSRTLG